MPAAPPSPPIPPIASTAPLLDVRELHVTLATAAGRLPALRGLSFGVARGQVLGLIGESGCGKSLTALALMGLLPEGATVEGSMRLEGTELVGLPERDWCRLRGDRVAMVFQEPMSALNPLHTVGAQIAEPLRLHRGLGRTAARAEALRLLERVQMPSPRERLDAWPHQLSGGQRQRVVIAIALACAPALLVADEPTTALDVTLQREVLALITQLVREDGMGLVLISHDLGLVADHADRLHVMYAGEIVERGATVALFAQPAHPYTRGLQAARPRVGLPRGVPLATIPGRVPALGAMPSGCAFAARCALAGDDCRAGPVAERTVAGAADHAARCLRVAVP
jgi:peptide/nickel transport system ATP-binding protein